jgi:hypothetical protein
VRNFIIFTHPQIKFSKSWESMGEEGKVYKVLVGKPEGKRPPGRPRHSWEDGIRMDLRETGMGVWIGFDCLRTGTGGGVW